MSKAGPLVVKSWQAPWQKRQARGKRGMPVAKEAGPVAKEAGPVQKRQALWQKGRPRGKRGMPYAEKAGPVAERQAPWKKGRPQESALFLGKGGKGLEAVVVLVLVVVVLEILEVDMIPNIKSKIYRSPTGNLKPPPWRLATVREESPSKHCSWRRRTAPSHLSFASASPRKGPPSPSRKNRPNGLSEHRRCRQRCGRS